MQKNVLFLLFSQVNRGWLETTQSHQNQGYPPSKPRVPPIKSKVNMSKKEKIGQQSRNATFN